MRSLTTLCMLFAGVVAALTFTGNPAEPHCAVQDRLPANIWASIVVQDGHLRQYSIMDPVGSSWADLREVATDGADNGFSVTVKTQPDGTIIPVIVPPSGATVKWYSPTTAHPAGSSFTMSGYGLIEGSSLFEDPEGLLCP